MLKLLLNLKKLTADVLDDLNYQFLRRLHKESLVTLKELFIDGTKIETNTSRYTFVWRGSINYHLAGLLGTMDSLYQKYNAFLNEHGYASKYGIRNVQMFVTEGMEKVRDVIEKNRKRKLAKHKKLSEQYYICHDGRELHHIPETPYSLHPDRRTEWGVRTFSWTG